MAFADDYEAVKLVGCLLHCSKPGDRCSARTLACKDRQQKAAIIAPYYKALEELVTLSSHYATLLNAHDGGERMPFRNAEHWMDRLRETGKLPKKEIYG